MGCGTAPPLIGGIGGSEGTRTASQASTRGGIPMRPYPVRLDRIGLSPPWDRTPSRVDAPIPPGSVPTWAGSALEPGCDRQRTAGLGRFGPTWSPSRGAGRLALCVSKVGMSDHRVRRDHLSPTSHRVVGKPSAPSWSDPLVLVVSCAPTPRLDPTIRYGLLAPSRLGEIRRFRAGVVRLDGAGLVAVLGRSGPGEVGTGGSDLGRPSFRTSAAHHTPRSERSIKRGTCVGGRLVRPRICAKKSFDRIHKLLSYAPHRQDFRSIYSCLLILG
jgi:hypothetical protein